MIAGIYKITCIINNKIYIGSSQNIEKRMKVHFLTLKNKKHKNPHMQSAYNLYGESNFKWNIIEICDKNFLKQREQFWMDFTNCYNREIGFNNCLKSDRPSGYKHTEEAKIKMKNAKIGKKIPKEVIAKQIAARKGFKHSQETKDKLSKSRMGEKNPMFGRKESKKHIKDRMKNMLAMPRWNKGLTKETDPRVAKLATWKGKIPPNALKCKIIDLEKNITYEGNSLKELAKNSKLSLISINRIKAGTCGKNFKKKYRMEII